MKRAFFLKNEQSLILQNAYKSKKNRLCPKSAIFDCMKTGDAEIAHKTWNRMKTEPSKLTYQFTTPYFPQNK